MAQQHTTAAGTGQTPGQLMREFMDHEFNQTGTPNIQRIESGPSYLDKSSEHFDGYTSAADAQTQYERGQQISKVCAAIQCADLDADGVRQILSTLGCRMKAVGFQACDVEMVETAGEVVG